MSMASSKKNSLLLVLTSTVLFVYFGYDTVNTDTSICHSAEAYNMYDAHLFENDLDVMASHDAISPRIGSNFVYLGLMILGLSFAEANYILFFLTCLLFGICVALFVKNENYKRPLFIVVLLSFLIGCSRIGRYAGFGLFDPSAPPLCLATALAFLAITLLITKKHINLAFLLIAGAALIHIHEGIYGIAFITLLAFHNEGIKLLCRWSLYVPIIVILALTLPNLYFSSNIIEPSLFHEIYVKWRTPHHLFIWDSGWYVHLFMLLSYIAIFLYALKKKLLNGQKKTYVILIAFFLAIVLIWYISYEALENKFFIKLYLPKAVKYISFLFTLLLVKCFSDDIDKRNVYAVIFLLSNLFLVLFSYKSMGSGWDNNYNNWLNCLIVLVAMSFIPEKTSAKNAIWVILIITSLFLTINNSGYYDYHICIYLWGLLALSFISNSQFEIMAICLMLIPFLNMKIKIKRLVKDPHIFVESTIKIRSNNDLYNIAKYIESNTAYNDVIICDAFDGTGAWLQYLSKRVVFTDYGTLPSSEKGIATWYERCKRIEDISTWSAPQLHQFLRNNHLKYVVLPNSNICNTYNSYFYIEQSNNSYCFLRLKE